MRIPFLGFLFPFTFICFLGWVVIRSVPVHVKASEKYLVGVGFRQILGEMETCKRCLIWAFGIKNISLVNPSYWNTFDDVSSTSSAAGRICLPNNRPLDDQWLRSGADSRRCEHRELRRQRQIFKQRTVHCYGISLVNRVT